MLNQFIIKMCMFKLTGITQKLHAIWISDKSWWQWVHKLKIQNLQYIRSVRCSYFLTKFPILPHCFCIHSPRRWQTCIRRLVGCKHDNSINWWIHGSRNNMFVNKFYIQWHITVSMDFLFIRYKHCQFTYRFTAYFKLIHDHRNMSVWKRFQTNLTVLFTNLFVSHSDIQYVMIRECLP